MLKRESNNNLIRYSVSPYTNFYTKTVKDYSFSTEDTIGKGYSSSVYRATKQFTKQVVAIKIIDLNSLTDSVKKNLLRTEIECLNHIRHPNLLHFIESFETKNNCYIVTEYCEKSDLEKLLRKNGRFSQNQVMDIFWQVFHGYEHLNSCGYMHRDLKPANLFCQGNQIKIADFGFAKRLSENPKDSYNVGTTIYMAPQSLNANIYTEKTDIWSLGIICYELTHGRVPWCGANQHQIKNQINCSQPSIDKKLVSPQLYDFLLRCLTINPLHRLSITQIRSHPWFLKIKQKIQSENELKFYSNTQQSLFLNLKQNRHTRKLTQNTPTHRVRQSMLPQEHVYSCDKYDQIKENKENGLLGMNTIKNQKGRFSQNIKPGNNKFFQQKNQKTGKSKKTNSQIVLEKLISILNFSRFQFKVHEFVKNHSMIENQNFIKFALMRKLLENFKVQENLIQTGENLFGIENWDQFKSDGQWSVYEKVIREYVEKYTKAYEQAATQIQNISPTNISNYLQQLDFDKIEVNMSQSLFRQLECLSYLFIIEQIYQMIEVKGWQEYIENYKSIVIKISSKKTINSNNCIQVYENLKNKQKCLFH